MGKAAQRRKERRLNYLVELATTNPERFRNEWDTLMSSWLKEVWRRAGKGAFARDTKSLPIFDLFDEACKVLQTCNVNKDMLDKAASLDVLLNECCKAAASEFGPTLYRLNIRLEKK
jgi:hypothetical protein